MQDLNLIKIEKSDIKYSFSRFPDGEVQITLDSINHKDKVHIICRITNAEELFILMQVCDILKRHGVIYCISIYYLMSMRMDRVMDFNRPFSLSIVCKILDSLDAWYIDIFSPHSEVYTHMFKNNNVSELDCIEKYPDLSKFQILLPDAGATERFYFYNYEAITCSKVRDLATGKITQIQIDNPEILTDQPILIFDDLCDGGRTFIEIAKVVRAIKPDIELNIFVKHMVNPKGIENLSSTFNHVWFTNSYKDWQNEILPNNVTVIEVV